MKQSSSLARRVKADFPLTVKTSALAVRAACLALAVGASGAYAGNFTLTGTGDPSSLVFSLGGTCDNSSTYCGTLLLQDPAGTSLLVPNGGSPSTGSEIDAQNVTLTNWTYGNAYSVVGGGSISGDAGHNNLTITGTTLAGSAIGGASFNGSANDNTVDINGSSSLGNKAVGGAATAPSGNTTVTANNNTVTLKDSSVTSTQNGGGVYGGVITDAAANNTATDNAVSNNRVVIDGGTVQKSTGTLTGVDVTGGSAGSGNTNTNWKVNVTNNRVDIYGNSAIGTNATNTVHISGGLTERGEVSGNSVFIDQGTIFGDVEGGWGYGDDTTVTGNHVFIGTGDTGEIVGAISITGNVYGGGGGSASDNTVTLEGGAIHGGGILGGRAISSTDGDATGNKVFIRGGSVGVANTPSTNVSGGYAVYGNATDNEVHVTGGTVGNSVIGGEVSSSGGTVADNKVFIDGGVVQGGVYGGYTWQGLGAITGNTVEITDGTVSGSRIYGGFSQDATSSTANVSGNKVLIGGGDFTTNANMIVGGATDSTSGGNATGNEVSITGGNFGDLSHTIYGGRTASGNTGTATGNTVTIGGSAEGLSQTALYGGYGGGDAFTGNTLNKNSATQVESAENFASVNFGYTGDAGIGTLYLSTTGEDTTLNTNSNDITFDGTSDITGAGGINKTGAGKLTLEGAKSYTGDTTIAAGTLELAANASLNSEVTVKGGSNFNLYGTVNGNDVEVESGGTLDISGTAGGDVNLAAGATLNAYQGGKIDGDLGARDARLNFHLPATLGANALLTVDGTADITNSTVGVVGFGGSSAPLDVGDSVTLLKAATLTGSPANATTHATGMQGVSLLYDFNVGASGNNLLAATLAVTVNPQTKALSEGFLAGTAFINQASDFIADQGIRAARQTSASGKTGVQAFAAIGGGSLKHKTGSHVDVDGYTLVAGLSASRALNSGELTLGAFIEHGEGDYSTYNSFSNAASVHGKGDVDYTGGGVLAHLEFAETASGKFYAEASARMGKADLDFKAKDLTDAFGRRAEYDADSTYTSAHAGLGYRLKLNEQSGLKLYGQYLWSQQDGDKARLSTGETVKFRSVSSQRTRLGAKWDYTLNQTATLYAGAAWEHEYDGKAKASIYGYRLDTPDLKGDTGLLEIGATLKPTPTKPLSLDLGLQGYSGKREGVTGSFKVNYAF